MLSDLPFPGLLSISIVVTQYHRYFLFLWHHLSSPIALGVPDQGVFHQVFINFTLANHIVYIDTERNGSSAATFWKYWCRQWQQPVRRRFFPMSYLDLPKMQLMFPRPPSTSGIIEHTSDFFRGSRGVYNINEATFYNVQGSQYNGPNIGASGLGELTGPPYSFLHHWLNFGNSSQNPLMHEKKTRGIMPLGSRWLHCRCVTCHSCFPYQSSGRRQY